MNIQIHIYKENKYLYSTIIDIFLDGFIFPDEKDLKIEQDLKNQLKYISKLNKKEIFNYFYVRENDWENIAPLGPALIVKSTITKDGYSIYPQKDTLISFAAYDNVWCSPVIWHKKEE